MPNQCTTNVCIPNRRPKQRGSAHCRIVAGSQSIRFAIREDRVDSGDVSGDGMRVCTGPWASQMVDVADGSCGYRVAHQIADPTCGVDWRAANAQHLANTPAHLQLVPAWSHIQSLTLDAPTPSRTTLASLHSLAKYCPCLELLEMYLDATSILDILCSPISAPAPVARFLSGIFPNLSEITTTRENEDNESAEELAENGEQIVFHQRWREVAEQILEFEIVGGRNSPPS
ncbi:hypothetical protein C8R44DRAFT_979175 [Mycena epipterygia]|nr:hypothetical protein C8R44DRAFT_979175 [Mycena epipterygia]